MATLCPLAQPNKAIGLESPIEPWLAYPASIPAAKPVGQRARCRTTAMPVRLGITTPRTRNHTGAGCRKNIGCRVQGEIFLLTSSFIELSPVARVSSPARPLDGAESRVGTPALQQEGWRRNTRGIAALSLGSCEKIAAVAAVYDRRILESITSALIERRYKGPIRGWRIHWFVCMRRLRKLHPGYRKGL